MLSWGLRMAIATALPIIWGIATGKNEQAEWITLAAEGICWVELKGSYGQRLRVLVGGAILTFLFGMLGTVTGINVWLSVGCMLLVGFLSGLFKNLGDRGSALSICLYVIFLLCNAHPITLHNSVALKERALYLAVGGGWSLLAGIVASAFAPAQQPYRRTIALIWRSISEQAAVVGAGWNGKGPYSNMRSIYLKEKEVRTAIDASFTFYEAMANEVSDKQKLEYTLAQARKATALTASTLSAISEELEELKRFSLPELLKLKLYDTVRSIETTAGRMAIYTVALRSEESLLLKNRLALLNQNIVLLQEEIKPEYARPLTRIVHLCERSVKLIERCIGLLQSLEETPAFLSYSLVKTLVVLHPKHWWRNVLMLFHYNSQTVRYAARIALASSLGLFIDLWFKLDHGYWLPFTIIIITQPYFGATLTKAKDRLIGTLLGVTAGSLFLHLHAGLHLKEILLFVTAIGMVRYLRTKYSVASFFITMNLVLLFAVYANNNDPLLSILLERIGCTIGGALIAAIAGFALLPTWDKKWLPRYLYAAVARNYAYFLYTFYTSEKTTAWTSEKRQTETANSNAFDSFTRFMQEPGADHRRFSLYYQLITHNVRITRSLNNFQLEEEDLNAKGAYTLYPVTTMQQVGIAECRQLFEQCLLVLQPQQPVPVAATERVAMHTLNSYQLLSVEKMKSELRIMLSHLEELQHSKAALPAVPQTAS